MSSRDFSVIRGANIPLDFISWVHTWINSWISSGATSLRDHASSHRGFGRATAESFPLACLSSFEEARGPSLCLKTLEKNGMAKAELCARFVYLYPRNIRWLENTMTSEGNAL